MYVIFRDQVLDSEEYKSIIEEKTNFKVEKDLSKATKRDDVMAFILSLDVKYLSELLNEDNLRELKININELDFISEEVFLALMGATDKKALEILDLFPKYSIIKSRAYRIDTEEKEIMCLVTIANVDITRVKLEKDILRRLLSQID